MAADGVAHREAVRGIVLLNTLHYRVEQLLLIHAETGLLLQHVAVNPGGVQDADQVSAMLTAIRDFVHDSFKVGGTESLDAFRVGDLSVMVEQSPYAVLAGVVRGTAPHQVRLMFREALESIHLLLGGELKAFTGDSAPFVKARPVLEACLVSERRQPSTAPAYRRWIALATLVLLALGAWTLSSFATSAMAAVCRSSCPEPGLIVLSSGRRGGRHFVAGLRDPLATDPASFMAAAQVDPARSRRGGNPTTASTRRLSPRGPEGFSARLRGSIWNTATGCCGRVAQHPHDG